MKRIILFLFAVGFLGSVGFFVLQGRVLNIAVAVESAEENKPFVVVIPSYNNALYVRKNLESLFTQNYGNYRVIYIDDASTDETLKIAKSCIEEHNMGSRVTLIENKMNLGAMHNFYRAIHSCANEEIVVVLDGDDWLKDKNVLWKLNSYYANPDTWMTYGQYERYPDGEIGCSAPVKRHILQGGKVRSRSWRYSHLRSFYAGLFKRIRMEDLFYEGAFYRTACDLAMMFPMLEMAREHARFIPEVVYVYNGANPISDAALHLKDQQQMDRYIRSLKVYPPLTHHPKEPVADRALADHDCDLVIFSYNRPMQLYALLESLEARTKGFRQIFVIYRTQEEYEEGYIQVKKDFPRAIYLEQAREDAVAHQQFKEFVVKLLKEDGSSYIAYAVDDNLITDDLDVRDAIEKLERFGAFGLYLRLAPHVDYCYNLDFIQGTPPLMEVDEGVFAWQFSKGLGDWRYPNTVDLTIYRKKDIGPEIAGLRFWHPNTMEEAWVKLARLDRIGLCFAKTKAINIPMNIVSTFPNRCGEIYSQEMLHSLFEHGLKIDIRPFYQIENRSCHIELEPEFVTR